LKYNDPSGHCATTEGGGRDWNAGDQCWNLVDSILNLWDHTDYWNTRYGSKEVFEKYVAPGATNDEQFFRNELNHYWDSDEYEQWAEVHLRPYTPPEKDFGDFTALTGSVGFFGGALIFDDYGNIYVRVDNNFIGSPGITLGRGDILIYQGDWTWEDIDHLNLTREEKRQLAPTILVGPSRGLSIGVYHVYAELAYNMSGPPHVTSEGGLSISRLTFSLSPASYTYRIYP
jgi:hypothetical protein